MWLRSNQAAPTLREKASKSALFLRTLLDAYERSECLQRLAGTLKLPAPRLLALRFEAVPRCRTLRMTQLRPAQKGKGKAKGKARESDSDSDDVDDAERLRLEREDAERCRLEREAAARRHREWEAAERLRERELAERYPGLTVSGTRRLPAEV